MAFEGGSNLALASGRLARTYLAIGPDNWSCFVADAERVTSAAVGNIRDLAAVVVSEAGDARLPEHARIAVGAVVMNRMSRNTTNYVRVVWGQFGHKAIPKAEHLKLAMRLLSGSIPDPTFGATHFYSPSAMPRDGDNPGNRDISGGLESVPGVIDQRNEPVLNYRPGFAKDFDEVFVPGVPTASFKFFRAPGHGPVR